MSILIGSMTLWKISEIQERAFTSTPPARRFPRLRFRTRRLAPTPRPASRSA